MTTEEKVEKLYVDMYVGGGKDDPSVTTRLSLLETLVTQISSNLSRLAWIVVGALVADILVRIMK